MSQGRESSCPHFYYGWASIFRVIFRQLFEVKLGGIDLGREDRSVLTSGVTVRSPLPAPLDCNLKSFVKITHIESAVSLRFDHFRGSYTGLLILRVLLSQHLR